MTLPPSPAPASARKAIEEILPGVYQIFGRQRAAHCYLIRGRNKNVLIDPGLPFTVHHVDAALAEIGMVRQDIDLIALTHEHLDHAGSAIHFADTALIAAHKLAAVKLALADDFAVMSRVYEVNAPELHVDMFFGEETTINLGNYELHVIHTPGHTSGSVCFYEPNHRLLFSGDTVMADGVVGGVLGSGNVSDYIHSLRRLGMYRIDRMLAGHGGPSVTPAQDIEKGIDRLETLLEDSKALFQTLQDSQHGFDQVLRSLRNLNV